MRADVFEHFTAAFEWIAVGIIVLAFVLSAVSAARDLYRRAPLMTIYRDGRNIFGRGVLVSLQILVAADLIHTVAVEPTFENVGVLGLIVIVRVILSFALDVEIEGVLPWRKRSAVTPVSAVSESDSAAE